MTLLSITLPSITIYELFMYVGAFALILTLLLGYGHSKIKGEVARHPFSWFVQYFLGGLLIFSGFIKGVDPLGTAYKMQDYFTEFGSQGLPMMDTMHEYALPFSVAMLVLELTLGACLILGIGGRKTTGITLLLMLFFTFLTGFNYLTGYTDKSTGVALYEFGKWGAFSDNNIRITDCGCFGDFMTLTPLATFIKDILYTGLGIFLFISAYRLKEILPRSGTVRTLAVVGLMGGSLFFCLNNYYLELPMIDFRPFKEGTDLNQAKADCDANPGETRVHYVYQNKKTGKTVEVNDLELVKPANKHLWTPDPVSGEKEWEALKEQTSYETIVEGCNSQIKYFENYEVLEQKGYQFLVLAKDLDKADKEAFKKIGANAAIAEKEGIPTRAMYNFIGEQSIDEFRQEVNGAYDFETADDKLIKTIVRANPGLVLLKDGVVIKKWHHKHIPTYEEIKAEYMK